jgi:IS5 family transposase
MAMKQGTIIDSTLIAAPTSTKNKQGERDSDMHQTQKGNQWYYRCAEGCAYLGPPEKGKSTAAQLVSAIETR